MHCICVNDCSPSVYRQDVPLYAHYKDANIDKPRHQLHTHTTHTQVQSTPYSLPSHFILGAMQPCPFTPLIIVRYPPPLPSIHLALSFHKNNTYQRRTRLPAQWNISTTTASAIPSSLSLWRQSNRGTLRKCYRDFDRRHYLLATSQYLYPVQTKPPQPPIVVATTPGVLGHQPDQSATTLSRLPVMATDPPWCN